jgi:hypothetical protein
MVEVVKQAKMKTSWETLEEQLSQIAVSVCCMLLYGDLVAIQYHAGSAPIVHSAEIRERVRCAGDQLGAILFVARELQDCIRLPR